MDEKKLKNGINLVDYVLLGIIGLIGFLFFCHSDLLITAQRSYCYLDGDIRSFWGNLADNISHFYTKSWQMAGEYGANYMPSTFILFAIWNIPYKLIASAPAFWGDWSLGFLYWNKLLPIIFYIMSGILFYRISHEDFGMDQKKSKIVMYMFMASPLAFFSQFLFCQYDSFTVFFMLLGIHYFFKGNSGKINYKFLLCFGMATTFKYFAILVLVILLVLSEKKIWKLLYQGLIALLPIALEMGFYLITDGEVFKTSVFKFKVLEYTSAGGISVGFAAINLLPLILCLIIAVAYLKEIHSREELISNFVFFSCGICFALFSFMTWHPQWLLFAVPFWTWAFSINKNYKALLWVDTALAVIFNFFVASKFINNVDQTLLKYGLLSPELRYVDVLEAEQTMSAYFYKDMNMLFTLLVAVFAIYFIYAYPKNAMEKISSDITAGSNIVKVRFLIGALTFIIPAFLCVPAMKQQRDNLWDSWQSKNGVQLTEYVNKKNSLMQYALLDGESLSSVGVYTFCHNGVTDELILRMKIKNVETGEIVYRGECVGAEIAVDGYTKFDLENVPIKKGAYLIMFSSNTKDSIQLGYAEYSPGGVSSSISYRKSVHMDEYICLRNRKIEKATLFMNIKGEY